MTDHDEVVQLRPAGGPHELRVFEAVVIRPGDKLLMRFSDYCTEQEAAEVRDRALARMPELADVIVVCAEQIAVLRPEAGTDG